MRPGPQKDWNNMLKPVSPAPLGEAMAAALRYLCHFPEALEKGATVCLPTEETLFISAETARGTPQGDAR